MLKVGDKLKVRSDFKDGIKYGDIGIRSHAGMLKFKGQEVSIRALVSDRDDVFYINEDIEGYLWHTDMMENCV